MGYTMFLEHKGRMVPQDEFLRLKEAEGRQTETKVIETKTLEDFNKKVDTKKAKMNKEMEAIGEDKIEVSPIKVPNPEVEVTNVEAETSLEDLLSKYQEKFGKKPVGRYAKDKERLEKKLK